MGDTGKGDIWAQLEESDDDDDDISENWQDDGEEVFHVEDTDYARGAQSLNDDVWNVGKQQIETYQKSQTDLGDSGDKVRFAQILRVWDTSMRTLWFSTKLDGGLMNSEIAYLVGLTLQFFSGTVPKIQDTDVLKGAKPYTNISSRIDIMNLNTDNWSLFGYYICEKVYTEFSLNFFLTAGNKVGVNLRSQSGDTNCVNKLVDYFYDFLERQSSTFEFEFVEVIEQALSDSEPPSESLSSDGYVSEREQRGVIDLAKNSSTLEAWLDVIERSSRKGKRQTLLKLAHSVRDDLRNTSFMKARNADMEVSRMISSLLVSSRSRPSTFRAAVMALEALHEQITDEKTLQNVVQCLLELRPQKGMANAIDLKKAIQSLGKYALEKAQDFRDDFCQNLKDDLLNLVKRSNVLGGVEPVWKKDSIGTEFDVMDVILNHLEEMKNENEDVQESQPSYLQKHAYQSIIEAILPTDLRKWDEDQFLTYVYCLFDEEVKDSAANAIDDADSYLDALLEDEDDELAGLRSHLKGRMQLLKEAEQKEEATSSIPWESLTISHKYCVRKGKDEIPNEVEPWVAGMRLKLNSKDKASDTVSMSLRNGKEVTLPRTSICDLPHSHPGALEISVLTSNSLMVDHSVLARRGKDMSEFLNSMRVSMEDVIKQSPYEIKYFHGPLTSKHLTNEQVHILQLQGISPQRNDDSREFGLILEDEADMGIVTDLESLSKRFFRLHSCKILVLAQQYCLQLLNELHRNQKVPHILALSRSQQLDSKAAEFLKVFYNALQVQCLTIKGAYDEAVSVLGGTGSRVPFILYPEGVEGHHEKRLIDVIYNGILDKPTENAYEILHARIPSNASGDAEFGNVVPEQIPGTIPNDYIHRVCDHAMSFPLTIAECLSSPVKTADEKQTLFEYDIANLAANITYRLSRSHWNENNVSDEHRYRHGIAHIKLGSEMNGGEMLIETYTTIRSVLDWDKTYDDPKKIQKRLVKKLKKKKMCLIFELPTSLGDDPEHLFETLASLTKGSKTLRVILLVPTELDGSELLSKIEDSFDESDANVQFDLEDEDYLQEMLQNSTAE